MNGRILLGDARDYLQGLAAFSGVRIGTAYETDYLEQFPKLAPAIWFAGQQLTRKDDGLGYTSRMRQHATIEIAARICVPRLTEGQFDAEPALQDLQNKFAAAMYGWMIDGADHGFVWARAKDGPQFQSIIVADVVMSTAVTYTV